jgi:hypothetical protein
MKEQNLRERNNSFVKILNILIPRNDWLSLPGAGDLAVNQQNFESVFQHGYEKFLNSFEMFLGKKPSEKYFIPEFVIPFVNQMSPEIEDFLFEILSFYYSNSEITSKIPNFSGVIFPNSRILPHNNLDFLELVIANTQWQKGR